MFQTLNVNHLQNKIKNKTQPRDGNAIPLLALKPPTVRFVDDKSIEAAFAVD